MGEGCRLKAGDALFCPPDGGTVGNGIEHAFTHRNTAMEYRYTDLARATSAASGDAYTGVHAGRKARKILGPKLGPFKVIPKNMSIFSDLNNLCPVAGTGARL